MTAAVLFAFFFLWSKHVVHVGTARVHLVMTGKTSGPTYIHLHEDEHTSAETTRTLVEHEGGTLCEIQCKGTRLISFHLKGTSYQFDPNRMFTDIGLEKSLAYYSRNTSVAFKSARRLRNAVLAIVKRSGGPIIAVHNNAPNGMSMESYLRGGRLSTEAKLVAENDATQPHEFLLVLDEDLFNALKRKGFNVALQPPAAADDGSLSVYCHMHGLRYANIEAGEGHAAEQKRMLEALLPLL